MNATAIAEVPMKLEEVEIPEEYVGESLDELKSTLEQLYQLNSFCRQAIQKGELKNGMTIDPIHLPRRLRARICRLIDGHTGIVDGMRYTYLYNKKGVGQLSIQIDLVSRRTA